MSASPDPSPVTVLLLEASGGDREALNRLFPLVYGELKWLAGAKLRMERSDHTLNATALVHEAYVKLVDQTRVQWRNRRHFFTVASLAMRRILLDYATARNAHKRGGRAEHVSLDEAHEILSVDQARTFIALDEALERLSEFNPRGAEVVQGRFFCGLTNAEIARAMGLSEVTVRRSWTVARAWLRRELGDEVDEGATRMLGGGPPSSSGGNASQD